MRFETNGALVEAIAMHRSAGYRDGGAATRTMLRTTGGWTQPADIGPGGKYSARRRDDPMKVRIDTDRCQGHQMCAIAAPEVFGSDDYGFAVVLFDGPVPPELEAATRRAEGSCPERAVIIEP